MEDACPLAPKPSPSPPRSAASAAKKGLWKSPAEVELAVRERTAPIQDILPDHSPDEREQIITGIHGACWDAKFGAFDIFDCEDDPEEG